MYQHSALKACVGAVWPQVCGPYGTGKTEVLQQLLEALPSRFAVPAVHTTAAGQPALHSAPSPDR
jgi:Ni2+-binding GTPase involved in maturation of urease and hydrogenase